MSEEDNTTRVGNFAFDYNTSQLLIYEGDTVIRYDMDSQRWEDLVGITQKVNTNHFRGKQ